MTKIKTKTISNSTIKKIFSKATRKEFNKIFSTSEHYHFTNGFIMVKCGKEHIDTSAVDSEFFTKKKLPEVFHTVDTIKEASEKSTNYSLFRINKSKLRKAVTEARKTYGSKEIVSLRFDDSFNSDVPLVNAAYLLQALDLCSEKTVECYINEEDTRAPLLIKSDTDDITSILMPMVNRAREHEIYVTEVWEIN